LSSKVTQCCLVCGSNSGLKNCEGVRGSEVQGSGFGGSGFGGSEVRRFGVLFHTDGHRSLTQKHTDFYICLIIKFLCISVQVEGVQISVSLRQLSHVKFHTDVTQIKRTDVTQNIDY